MSPTRSIIIRVSGTSVRKVDLAAVPLASSRAEQIAQLRAQISQMGGGAREESAGQGLDLLPIDGPLGSVLPGGLPRRAITHLSDTPGLVVELLRHVTAAGGHAGVVGWSELSYAALPAAGLERIIAVPDAGVDPLGVAGVLVEGLDLVVFRSPVALELSPVRARPLLGKLRKGHAALMLVGATVPSPALSMTGEVVGFHGIGRGTGRIMGMDVRVRVTQKNTRPASTVITVGDAPAPALRVVR